MVRAMVGLVGVRAMVGLVGVRAMVDLAFAGLAGVFTLVGLAFTRLAGLARMGFAGLLVFAAAAFGLLALVSGLAGVFFVLGAFPALLQIVTVPGARVFGFFPDLQRMLLVLAERGLVLGLAATLFAFPGFARCFLARTGHAFFEPFSDAFFDCFFEFGSFPAGAFGFFGSFVRWW